MRISTKLISVIMIFIFITSARNPVVGKISGQTFVIAIGNDASHYDFGGFMTEYGKDNTVTNGTADVATLLTNADALFLPGNMDLNTTQYTAISTWFALGNKLLWVAGDSDYVGGYHFLANVSNPILEGVGSVLRLDGGAVDDPVNNDGASYRVVATQSGTSDVAKKILKGISNTSQPFHGPTSVYYVDGTTKKDLRGATVENVTVLQSSADTAVVIDQDISINSNDFYFTQSTKGSYPLLAIEEMGDSMVVVSGESIFSDYKNMYLDTFEKSGLKHPGKTVVDNIIKYFYGEPIGANEDDSPIDLFSVFGAIFLLSTVSYAIKKRKYSNQY